LQDNNPLFNEKVKTPSRAMGATHSAGQGVTQHNGQVLNLELLYIPDDFLNVEWRPSVATGTSAYI
jgi:hypothetical protein